MSGCFVFHHFTNEAEQFCGEKRDGGRHRNQSPGPPRRPGGLNFGVQVAKICSYLLVIIRLFSNRGQNARIYLVCWNSEEHVVSQAHTVLIGKPPKHALTGTITYVFSFVNRVC